MLKNYLDLDETYYPQDTKMRDVYTAEWVGSLDGTLLVDIIAEIVQTVDILKPDYKKCVENPE